MAAEQSRALPLGDDIACSVRVIDGTVRGLTTRWPTGHAVLKLRLTIINGLRTPVLDTPEAGRRPVRNGEIISVDHYCTVLPAQTTNATLEWRR